jgi:hypothetical protein
MSQKKVSPLLFMSPPSGKAAGFQLLVRSRLYYRKDNLAGPSHSYLLFEIIVLPMAFQGSALLMGILRGQHATTAMGPLVIIDTHGSVTGNCSLGIISIVVL